MSNEKILNKIKKLFALGSNNPNENEAKSAIRMAKKLLDKHNFSMYELKDKEHIGITIEDYVNMPWVRIIYGSVARLFDSKYVIDKTCKPAQHLIIGAESNRVTASIVIHYVLSEIRREFSGMGNGVRNSAASGVHQQVNSILSERNTSREEVIPGTGLVAMDLSIKMSSEIDEWIQKSMGSLGNSYNNCSSDNRGTSFGQNINLGVQISNKKAINN